MYYSTAYYHIFFSDSRYQINHALCYISKCPLSFAVQRLYSFLHQDVLVLISLQRTPTESGVYLNTIQIINKSKAFTSTLITSSIRSINELIITPPEPSNQPDSIMKQNWPLLFKVHHDYYEQAVMLKVACMVLLYSFNRALVKQLVVDPDKKSHQTHALNLQ